jgi:hypothetical protein
MASTGEKHCLPDKRLAAVCGLFCPACTIFIGSQEDPERLEGLARRLQHPVEELECHGCRSETQCFFCREHCKMIKCAAERGVDFCGQCPEYPCADLKTFQMQRPHRIELWKSQERIKEAGFEKWYAEMIEHYSCPECHTLNSAYDPACRKCGHTPSCAYVSLHQEEIMRHLSGMK